MEIDMSKLVEFNFKKKNILLSFSCLAAIFAPGLSAQQLEEIVVTAERRETSLQDTPISVLSFSTEILEARGVQTMEDLATNAPNLDIKGSRGTGNVSPTYQIRGISGGGGATGERGVGFYLDGVFVPRQTGPYMQVLDLERIEILRGPQGTLFGRNSLGGAIRVFSQQPTQEKDGYIQVTGGNFSRSDVNLMFNTPLSDTFAVRGQAAFLSQDGYVSRGPQELGSSENVVLRLRAAWEASENVSVNFGVMHLDSESDGNPQDLETFDMAPVDPINGVSDVISFEGGYADWMSDFLEASGQPRLSNNDPRLLLDDYNMPSFCFIDDIDPDWDDLCLQVNENTYTQYDMTINWELSDTTTLTSVSGYSDFESRGVTDWQMLGMERRPSEAESWTFYQELQLNSSLFDGAVDLVSGVSFFHETSDSPRNYLLQATGTSIFGAPGLPFFTPTNQNPNGNGWTGGRITGDNAITQESDSWGLFLNGTWHATDMINITAGARFAYDEKDYKQTEYASANFTPAPGTDSTTVTSNDDWSEVDWRATVDYHPTDDLMVYGTISKAYRAGSFAYSILDNVPGPDQSGDFIQPIPPEKVINKEIGFRSELFNSRLRFNLTYFDMEYSDRQNPSAVSDPNSPVGFTIQLRNQGNIDIDGLELDTQLVVTDNFSLNASAGWVDTTVNDVCVNNGIYLFPSPAKESYQVGGLWDFDLNNNGALKVSLNYAYTGPQQTHPGGVEAPTGAGSSGCGGGPFGVPVAEWFLDSRYELPGYGLLNARVTYTSPDDRWEVALFGNNINDKEYGNFASRFGGGYWEGGPPAPVNLKAPLRSALGVTRGRPLNWGLSFKYRMNQGL
jgi:iron complex outermembrane recepter protein